MSDSAYQARAEMYRLRDPVLLHRAICGLARRGLTPRDISVALRLDMGSVLEALHGSRERAA